MKKNIMGKNLRKSITKSIGRYLAIAAIIALGAGIFVGLRATRTDMVATGQFVADQQNMFDLRLLGSYGWKPGDVDRIKALDSIESAEGAISVDAIASIEGGKKDTVFRFHSLPQAVSQVVLRAGRMPEAPNECLADGFFFPVESIGTTITLSSENKDDVFDSMACDSYTVVGVVSTPLYMDRNRGGTNVGDGRITTYFYLPEDGFDMDVYTEIGVTIPGHYDIYSDEYNNALDRAAEEIESYVQSLADDRLAGIKADAESEYSEGYNEYLDGKQELEDKRTEVQGDLDKAYQDLTDGEKEIADKEQLLSDGEKQLRDGKNAIAKNERELKNARKELEQAKSDTYGKLDAGKAELDRNASQVSSGLAQVKDGLAQIDDGLQQVNGGIAQLEAALPQVDNGIKVLEPAVKLLENSVKTLDATLKVLKLNPHPSEEQLEIIEKTEAELNRQKKQLEEASAKLAQLKDLKENGPAQLEQLRQTKAELEQKRAELLETQKQLKSAQASIQAGYRELEAGRAKADEEFAAAEAQIADGEAQLKKAKSTLSSKEKELHSGKQQLEDGKEDLKEGWSEYEDGKQEFDTAIAEGEAELSDAEQKLLEARADIDALEDAKIYILDRNTNIGYASLDSNSNIVAGVSKVFPVFFLLVASLVCITTMTRMVSDERTQIGTLKALGYSDRAIISKYLVYAGSSAVLGCTFGVIVGSIVFPTILWKVYGIMLYIRDDVVIRFDWPLCIGVVVLYTLVILLVTWYSCHHTLKEKPADLIRPKAPTSGKQIFLERFKFWRRLSFLNKVSLRNIFRYRQRLAMMLIGIGGCTALLVTGYGIRDSIADIASFQFEEISHYDLEVYFKEGQTPEQQAAFVAALGDQAEDVLFYHQSSAELEFSNKTRDIPVIATDSQIQKFYDFHDGDKKLTMPEKGETLLSVGMAKALGIKAGDTLTLRDTEMQPMTVTVSALFDNNVGNYAIVLPETVQEQWGSVPEQQMAFITAAEGVEVHDLSAAAANLEDVMNVSVNQDKAETIHAMMDALDLVVVTVVFCAAALAVIVLYNLTNINITERIREIATIKVLGFNSRETASYVFKENLALTFMGALVGLPMGQLLLHFVISQITVDIVWFQPRVQPLSYLISFVLTLLSALFVNFIFYFKLEKINMAEALKSVE